MTTKTSLDITPGDLLRLTSTDTFLVFAKEDDFTVLTRVTRGDLVIALRRHSDKEMEVDNVWWVLTHAGPGVMLCLNNVKRL